MDAWNDTTSADVVTDEILNLFREVVDGWYQEGPIDWEDVLDRVDGAELEDGTKLDIGNFVDSPAIRKIKSTIRSERQAG